MPAPAQVVHVHVPAADVNQHLMSLFERIRNRSSYPEASKPATGVFHYKWEKDEQSSRIHLRIDPDGSGLLIVNANRVFHLNPSATRMAFYALGKVPHDKAVKSLAREFEVKSSDLIADYDLFQHDIESLVNNEVCPICDLDLETTAPFCANLTAPYRMDLALTYRCNNSCAHCYNARPRNFAEKSTHDWFNILDKLWEIGIPHIVFTGGEPTLREDLPDLIRHAEKNGQITGLNTNGRKLSDKSYVNRLVESGLDHVQITLESHDARIHDKMVCHEGAWEETVTGIRNVLDTRLYVMTNTTMLTHNQSSIPQTLEFLAAIGLPTVGLNALIYSGRGKTVGTGLLEAELSPLLNLAKKITSDHNQKLIWYTPTQYCNFDPVLMDLGVKGCTAALYNMCTEPDGNVIPCQSYYQPLGNILDDPWEMIWNHDLAISLRERRNVPSKCNGCLVFSECGGGCPLSNVTKDCGGFNESQA